MMTKSLLSHTRPEYFSREISEEKKRVEKAKRERVDRGRHVDLTEVTNTIYHFCEGRELKGVRVTEEKEKAENGEMWNRIGEQFIEGK